MPGSREFETDNNNNNKCGHLWTKPWNTIITNLGNCLFVISPEGGYLYFHNELFLAVRNICQKGKPLVICVTFLFTIGQLLIPNAHNHSHTYLPTSACYDKKKYWKITALIKRIALHNSESVSCLLWKLEWEMHDIKGNYKRKKRMLFIFLRILACFPQSEILQHSFSI